MAPYSSFHPPLSVCGSLYLSLSHIHILPPTSLTLSLSLSLPSFAASSHSLIGLQKELIAVCACAIVSLCVFKMVSNDCKERGGLTAPHHLGYLSSTLPSISPSVTFTRNAGDMRTQGWYVHPMCCCSVQCIIHEMTGSGMADGRRGCYISVWKDGASLIVALWIYFRRGGNAQTHKILLESCVTQKSAANDCKRHRRYSTALAKHANYLTETFPLLLPQSFPE